MLANKDAMATIAVKDLAVAKKFYQQILGFSPTGVEGPGVVTLRSGNSTIVIYEVTVRRDQQGNVGDLGCRRRHGIDRANS